MKYYVVQLNTGEYDDWSVNTIFITDKEYKAKFYCSKGNCILEKYRKYYQDLRNTLTWATKMNKNYGHWSMRADFTAGQFNYFEIEFRKDIKIKP